MAKVVLGVGTSHTPQISMGADMWMRHSDLVDTALPGYEAMLASEAVRLGAEISQDVFNAKYARCQASLDYLAQILSSVRPDVVLVFGDDQRELFNDDCNPSIAVFCGDEVWDRPRDHGSLRPSQIPAEAVFHGESDVSYQTHRPLGEHLAAGLVRRDFDVATVRETPPQKSIGHAFTFLQRRLGKQSEWKLLPIWLNTYYPPNQPSARRCYEVGESVRSLVETWPGSERVAVVASGGLSHFVVDEDLDKRVITAIAEGDRSTLESLPEEHLQSGSSEIKNWVAAAGALQGFSFTLCDYVAGYRSLAGTGVGCAFSVWQ